MQLPSGAPHQLSGQNSSGHTPLSGHSRSESQSSATNTQTTTIKQLPAQTQQQPDPTVPNEDKTVPTTTDNKVEVAVTNGTPEIEETSTGEPVITK